MAAKFFTLAALVALVNAHIEMVLPVPFDAANLNNSPLDASGSDFPCKNPDYSSIATMNEYQIGGKGQLQFMGTAVHGGGSCQVSITYDNPPTKDSVWKVIKSFEGGCPARNTPGNAPGDSAELPTPDTYDFEIPGIPAGEAILAWTWFNKVGNREMYMNCAPIKISGDGNADKYAALPDMFRANIASETTCTTPADHDIQFPDPGVVELNNGATSAFAAPGSCTSAAGSKPTPDAPATPPAATPEPEVPGGVFVGKPANTKAAVVVPTSKPAAPAAPAAPATGSCTSGNFNCIDGTSFAQCANGSWAAAVPMAAGTKCTPGESTAAAFAILAA